MREYETERYPLLLGLRITGDGMGIYSAYTSDLATENQIIIAARRYE